MRKVLQLTFLFICIGFNSQAQIVISQYVETNSGSAPKGIEVWNPTANDIDLSVASITVFKGTNGATPTLDHTVNSGILKAGNVIVIGTINMDPSMISGSCPDALFSEKTFTFNGDDAVVLYLDGVIQDVIGIPGSDPGSSWSSNGVSTANQNIQLISGITTGDTDGWTDPSERFTNIGAGNTVTDIGKPTDGCPNTGGDTDVQFDLSSSSFNENEGTVTVCVNINNEDATNATTVDIDLDGGSSSTNGSDYTMITYPTTLTFPAGSNAQQCLSIDITDDTDEESDETIILNLTNPIGGLNAMIGANTQHTLTINANDVPVPSTDVIRINEVDSDTPGADVAEFVELFGTPNYPLDGLVLVLYNGSGDVSYNAIDLDNQQLDASGYFIIGGAGAPGSPEMDFGGQTNQIQNGDDAVALYVGDDTDFPTGTAIKITGLVDALVYGAGSADPGLAVLYSDANIFDFDEMVQVDENINNDSQNQSIQRGSWFVTTPTPRAENVLPVKLTSFTVETKDGKNLLNWATATEINNDYFQIERSQNGNRFETVGKVIGNGTTYSSISYDFIDENPLSGSNYYRLKQVDLDGRFEYSDMVRADNSASKIRIYPTATSDYITIDMDEQQVASLVLLNEVGQVVKDMSISEMKTRIDISKLPNGFYYIQVNAQSGKETKKIIKQ